MAKIQNGADKGKVQIANDVVATISATAAMEIDGVFSMASSAGGMTVFARKNLTKGVKVTIDGNEILLDMNIVVRFGYRILEVSENVQQRVKNAVQTMTGLSVRAVNVVVSSVYLEKEAAPAKPLRKDKQVVEKTEISEPEIAEVTEAGQQEERDQE